MATNEEIMAVVKKTQAMSEEPGGMVPQKYNTLTEKEKVILFDWMEKQKGKLSGK